MKNIRRRLSNHFFYFDVVAILNILYFLPTLVEGSKYCGSGEGILPYEKVTAGLCKDPITNELECQNASIYLKIWIIIWDIINQ